MSDMRLIVSSVVLLAILQSVRAQTPIIPDHFAAAGQLIGKAGTLNADGSYRINFPRTDVEFKNSNGMKIEPDLGLATYIAFSGTKDKSLAVGDFAMLESEIDLVFDALRSGGFEIVALHNHMTAENPRLFFAHFQGIGSTEQFSRTFKKALSLVGKGQNLAKRKTVTGKKKLDQEALEGLFGAKAQVFPSGVLRFTNPRKDLSVDIEGQKFLPGMGLASWVAFSACECGETMAMGDTCCLRSELQFVIDALRKQGIHITAIHNHILGGNIEVSFLHYESEGEAQSIAKAVKECWSKLGKKPISN